MITKLSTTTKVNTTDLPEHNIVKIELFANSHPTVQDIEGEIYVEYNTGIKLDSNVKPKMVLLLADNYINNTDLCLLYNIPDIKELKSKTGFNISFKLTPLGQTNYTQHGEDLVSYQLGDLLAHLIIYK